MDMYQVEKIKDAAQGLCGLTDVMFEAMVMGDVGHDQGEMKPDTFCKLLQSAKLLAHELNAATESLEDHVILRDIQGNVISPEIESEQ